MRHALFPAFTAALLVVAGAGLEAQGQSGQEDLSAAALSMDGRFWQAYNACDTAAFGQFFTDDVEFYHDKGGMTMGSEALTESLRTALCSGGARLRREAVEDTVRVYPMRERDAAYGAIVAGEHRFYVREGGGPERLDGLARFMNLWLLEDGTTWKMSRVLSYDHGPAPYLNTREKITLDDSELDAFAGSYQTNGGTMRIRRGEGGLVLSSENGGMAPLNLYPESDRVFFVMERDLTLEFVPNAGTMKMRVRERGTVVEEAVRRD